MGMTIFNPEGRRKGRSLGVNRPLGLIVLATYLAMGNSVTAQTTVTMPRQVYGLGPLRCAEYSPDGRYVVTGGGGGAFLWDLQTGQIVRRYLGYAGVGSVAFSADGEKLLTGNGDGSARLWSTADGTVIRVFDRSGRVDLSPDGVHALIDGWLFDAVIGREIREVHGSIFSPDGSMALGISGSDAKIWSVSSGTLIQTFSEDQYAVTAVAFSPDGTKILTGGGGVPNATAKLWNVEDGSLVHTFDAGYIIPRTHTPQMYSITSVDLSPNGDKIILGGPGTGSTELYNVGVVEIWNFSGELIDVGFAHYESVNIVQFSPGGLQFLTGGDDNQVEVWRTDSPPPYSVGAHGILTLSGHVISVMSLAVSPDGKRLISGTISSAAKLWDSTSGIGLGTLWGSRYGEDIRIQGVHAVAYSPDASRILAVSKGWVTGLGPSTFVDLSGHGTLAVSWGQDGACAEFSPDGRTALTGGIVFLETWIPLWIMLYEGHEGAALWDVTSGTMIRTLDTGAVYSVAFSPDGIKALTSGSSGGANLWSTSDGTSITHFARGGKVDFSPDDRYLLIDGWLYDAQTFQELHEVHGTVFSSDGTMVLGPSGNNAALWRTSDGALLKTFSGHDAVVTSVAFTPDGQNVVTGSADGTARLWEIWPAKAIIVAGGGPYPGNEIAAQTQELAKYAYKICRRRGYGSNEIQYLSAFGSQDADGDGNNDVDAYATPGALYDAIEIFSSDTSRLFIYMVDHGFHICNDMWFQVNPTQKVSADVLDFCLDELQTSRTCHVTLVVDSCYSGHFLSACRPPAGAERITIASTTKDDIAIFLPPPSLTSFSYQFLGALYMGYKVQQAFVSARRFFVSIGNADQEPWMDADGDGVYTEGEDDASTGPAALVFFGTSWAYAGEGGWEPPVFEGVTLNQSPALGSTVTIWAQVLPGQSPQRVWATILPPDSAPLAGQPLTDLPRVELVNTTGTLWEAPFGPLEAVGDYVVAHVAQFGFDRITQPVYSVFSVGAPPSPPPIKAILVSGDDGTGDVSSQTVTIVNLAYRVSRHRGFAPDDIKYLSAYGDFDADGDGDNDVRSSSTLSNLNDATANWAKTDCERLLLYLAGPCKEIDGKPQYYLNAEETLDAETLDGWLDDLQTAGGVQDVIVVVDFPYAADFLRGCQPPANKRRVLIAATDSPHVVFQDPPQCTSFSFEFLASVHMGRNLYDSYVATSLFFMGIPNLHQMPWLDSTGDGVSNWQDREYAENLYWGYPWAFAGPDGGELHAVLDAGPHVTGVTDEVVFWADVTEGPEPVQVIATIIPPSIEYTPGQATTEFPWLELIREGGSWRWSKTTGGFDERGEYTLLFHAVYDCDRLSSPMQVQLQVAGDAYEVDDTAAEASEYLFSLSPDTPTTQVHNFHDPGDTDWVKFYGSGGEPYTLHVEDPGTSCNPVIELYDLSSGTMRIAGPVDFNGPGQGESLSVASLPTTGTYYWVVYGSDPSVFGVGTSYTLRISYDGGPGLPIGTALPVSARRMDVGWLPSYGSGNGYLVFHRPVAGETMRAEATDGWTTRTPSPIQSQTFLDIGLQPVTTYEYVVRISGTNDPVPPACTPVFSGTTYEESSFASFQTPAQWVEEDAGTVSIPFRLMDPSLETVTVHYSMGGTATAGDDYSTDSSSAIFAPGETTASAILPLVQDGMVEPDETIVVTITDIENAGWGSTTVHTITIIGNDTDAQRWSLYP